MYLILINSNICGKIVYVKMLLCVKNKLNKNDFRKKSQFSKIVPDCDSDNPGSAWFTG